MKKDFPPKEEQYPLLKLLISDDGSFEVTRKRPAWYDPARYRGITKGASAVMSQWPSSFTNCIVTGFLIGGGLLLILLIGLASSVDRRLLAPRCLHNGRFYRHPTPASSPTIYLVHDDKPWQRHQLDAIMHIVRNYPGCRVDVSILCDMHEYGDEHVVIELSRALTDANSSSVREKRDVLNKVFAKMEPDRNGIASPTEVSPSTYRSDLNILIGSKDDLLKLQELDRHKSDFASAHKSGTPINTIQDLLQRYPMIVLRVIDKHHFFAFSPLYAAWRHLNDHTLLFAARVLQLWDHGGASFELSDLSERGFHRYYHEMSGRGTETNGTSSTDVPLSGSPLEEKARLDKVIGDLETFIRLPVGVVSADDEGVHIETKQPCHAFIGEILMNLRTADNRTRAAHVIRETLSTFCKTGAVDVRYCRSINIF